jgi:endonuclease/exonuclease/phosphatase family metal-dependent hydrolase
VPATLSVATWNIRAAIGPGPFPDRWWSRIDPDRLTAIGDFLAGTGADVIALQEVALVSRDGDLVDNAGDLARQLGMAVRYGAVRSFEVVDDREKRGVGCFGNALLARQSIRDARTVALPAAPMDAVIEPAGSDHPAAGIRYRDAPPSVREPRSLLLADIGGVLIGSTHLSHVGSGERRLQATATHEAFGDAPRALLLGDLNAPIEASELEPLGEWTDAFDVPPGHEDRISTDDGWPIDHVLARGIGVESCRVARESGDLSDHYPVLAELDVAA